MHSPSIEFIRDLNWPHTPSEASAMARLCLLDLVGECSCGTQTELSRVINDHALQHLACGVKRGSRLLFNGAVASPACAALANGMTIDSVDAHDGYKPAKRHAGCGVLAAALVQFDSEKVSLRDGRMPESGPTEADGDSESPLPALEIKAKIFRFASPVIGEERTTALEATIDTMGSSEQSLNRFYSLIYPATD